MSPLFFHRKLVRHIFWSILSKKNVDILILTYEYNKCHDASFFLFKSEKKTDEGHLKQMREGLRNNILFGLNKFLFYFIFQGFY